jgi:hypothetical protein
MKYLFRESNFFGTSLSAFRGSAGFEKKSLILALKHSGTPCISQKAQIRGVPTRHKVTEG